MESTLKQCHKCGEWKMFHKFNKNKNKRDGFSLWCKECCKEYQKQYYKKNKNKKLNYAKQHYKENKEYYNEYQKQWRDKNKDHYKQYYKQYSEKNRYKKIKSERQRYKENRIKILADQKQYYKNNRDNKKRYYEENRDKRLSYQKQYQKENYEIRKNNSLKRRTLKAKLPFNFYAEDKKRALEYFNNCCAICGRSFDNLPESLCLSFDHWIPITDKRPDNPGTVPTNMIPICHGTGGCNNHKHNSDPKDWTIREYGEISGQEIINKICTYFEWIEKRQMLDAIVQDVVK